MQLREVKPDEMRQLDQWLASLNPWQRLALMFLMVLGILLVGLTLSRIFDAFRPSVPPGVPGP